MQKKQYVFCTGKNDRDNGDNEAGEGQSFSAFFDPGLDKTNGRQGKGDGTAQAEKRREQRGDRDDKACYGISVHNSTSLMKLYIS